ncbi:MAG TPA: helix-hairpin-helix domain-containing protein [Thermoplasmata archaeon]|nr:helix-hairpin-helix domain-containing protein [Thermoplasmata archaeon]
MSPNTSTDLAAFPRAMPTNAEVAEAFREIADLLDVLGERFKPEAYRRASRSLESLTEDLSAIARRDELRTIPGVGEAIEEKIRELLKTGRIAYRDRLRQEVPPGVLELLRLPGLGPKTARRFWTELGVEGPAELAAAIDAGKLEGMKGFGPTKIGQIRAALAAAGGGTASARMPIEEAYPIAAGLLAGLRASRTATAVEIAGSFRRSRETVGDLDVLATSAAPERVFDAFSGLPEVRTVRLRGGTKETVELTNGLQVDLRVVEPAAFGAALLYFTGSKDHNVHLRSIARDRGLKINEYGIFRGDERIGGRTEAEMYAALRLTWIPPELREDRGEIEAAAKGPLPELVAPGDLAGELHAHLPADAGGREVEALVAAARRSHLAYLGVVVGSADADGSVTTVAPPALARLASAGGRGLTVGRALEVGPGGVPAAGSGLRYDYLIVRPLASALGPPSADLAAPAPALVAHVEVGPSASGWIDWARRHAAAIEVGPGPERLDSSGARAAREAGVALHVPTGIDRGKDDPSGPVAIGFARRAGAGKADVRNAQARSNVTRSWAASRPA